jgi:hypothetical protein
MSRRPHQRCPRRASYNFGLLLRRLAELLRVIARAFIEGHPERQGARRHDPRAAEAAKGALKPKAQSEQRTENRRKDPHGRTTRMFSVRMRRRLTASLLPFEAAIR